MDTRKLIARKIFALIALFAIAAAVFELAPPATRLVVALLALPLETAIIVSLLIGADQHRPHSYSPRRHSLAD